MSTWELEGGTANANRLSSRSPSLRSKGRTRNESVCTLGRPARPQSKLCLEASEVGLTVCGALKNLWQGFREFLTRPRVILTEPGLFRFNFVPRQNFHLGGRALCSY